MQAYAAAGVTTLTLAPAGFTLEERLAALRAGTEALERAGWRSTGRAEWFGAVRPGRQERSAAVMGARGSSPSRPSH